MKKRIRNIILRWLFNIQRRARKRSMIRAIDEAKRITLETDKKVLIYFVNGEYQCITKQELKNKWKDREFIGWTIQELERQCEIKIESRHGNIKHQIV